MKKRIVNIIITSAFLIQIFGFGLALIVQKKESFSETENRLLADLPAISFDGYISGSLTKQIDTYISDHFPFKYHYVNASRKINSLYYFEGFRQEDDIVILAVNTGAPTVGVIDDIVEDDYRVGELVIDPEFDIEPELTESAEETEFAPPSTEPTASDIISTSETEPAATTAEVITAQTESAISLPTEPAVTQTEVTTAQTEPPTTTESITTTAPLPTAVTTTASPPATVPPETVPTVTAPPPTTVPPLSNDEAVSNSSGLLIIKDRLMETFSLSKTAIKKYTDSVNQLYNECGQPETYVMLPTSAAQLYLPDKYRNEKNDQYAAFDILTSQLDGPKYIDLRDTFEAHKDEYLYYVTDHHWTSLGAYYAYEAFSDALGMKALKLDEYQAGKRDGFRGSLYTPLAKYPQYESFKNVFDEVYYYYPKNSAKVYSYRTAALSNGSERKLIDSDYAKDKNLYNIFFGGDIPVAYIHSDIGNGKSIMVVRDSYGHAFLPYLVDSFEHIYAVEPRYFSKDSNPLTLSKIFKEKNIDTLLFINYSLTATGGYWMSWGNELQRIAE